MDTEILELEVPVEAAINAHCPGLHLVHSYTKQYIREYLLNHVRKIVLKIWTRNDSDHAFGNTILTKKLAQKKHDMTANANQTNERRLTKSKLTDIKSLKADTRKSSPACHSRRTKAEIMIRRK